jgi:hypothetical protein
MNREGGSITDVAWMIYVGYSPHKKRFRLDIIGKLSGAELILFAIYDITCALR